MGNHENAQECVNDTYLQAWNTIPPYRPHILSTFLGKITRNLSINLYKKNKREKRGGGQIALAIDELNEIIADKNSEAEFDRAELSAAINEFLAMLPEEKCKILVCRYWYAYSIAEIAERFRMKENTVSVTLNRLRQKMREHLISITNFEPQTVNPIYSIDELPADIDLTATFHIAVGDAYAIVSADMLTYDEIMSVLQSMNG